MENEQKNVPLQQDPEKPYVPRPRWQLLLAWIGLGLMVGLLILQLLLMLRGGGV